MFTVNVITYNEQWQANDVSYNFKEMHIDEHRY